MTNTENVTCKFKTRFPLHLLKRQMPIKSENSNILFSSESGADIIYRHGNLTSIQVSGHISRWGLPHDSLFSN